MNKVVNTFKNGKLIMRKTYDDKDHLLKWEKWTYDSKGNIIEWREYDGNNNLTAHVVYSRNTYLFL